LKRALLAILFAGFLIGATGCGGGGSETSTTGTEGAAGTGAAAGGGAPPPVATSTAQTSETTKPVAFTPTKETPASVKKQFKKKVLCIEFYLPADPVTADVARQVAPLKKTYAKQVAFLRFDVNNAAASAALTEQLKAGYSPYFVIIDKRGFIVYTHAGYIDRETLEQQLFSTLRR